MAQKVERKKSGRKTASELKGDAGILFGIAENAEIFLTPLGLPYASIHWKDRTHHIELESTLFASWIRHEYRQAAHELPSSALVSAVVEQLRSEAVLEAREQNVYVRFADLGDELYVDLADERGRVVRITDAGWRVIASAEAPVKFVRPKGLRALPEPTFGTLEALRPFVNVGTNDDFKLVVGWLLACLRTAQPCPILVLNGEQGAAKSTTARVLRSLLDPNGSPLRSLSRSEQDLAIAATNSGIVAFDNISDLPVGMSDALCRLATGSGLSTRKLYENGEEWLFDVRRPILLNGIEEFVTRGDLLDRSILLTLPPIADRVQEREFWTRFDATRSQLLGALFQAAAAGLAEEPVQSVGPARMADFVAWFTQVERGLGWPTGTAQRVYLSNRDAADHTALESAPYVREIESLAAPEWRGTAAQLLEELRKRLGHNAQLPLTPKALSAALTRAAPHMRRRGVSLERSRANDKTRERIIVLRTNSCTASEAVDVAA